MLCILNLISSNDCSCFSTISCFQLAYPNFHCTLNFITISLKKLNMSRKFCAYEYPWLRKQEIWLLGIWLFRFSIGSFVKNRRIFALSSFPVYYPPFYYVILCKIVLINLHIHSVYTSFDLAGKKVNKTLKLWAFLNEKLRNWSRCCFWRHWTLKKYQ